MVRGKLSLGCCCDTGGGGGDDCIFICYGGELGTGGQTGPTRLCVGNSFTDTVFGPFQNNTLPGCPLFTSELVEFSLSQDSLTVDVYCDNGGDLQLIHTESFGVNFDNSIARSAVSYQNPLTMV